MEKYDKNIKAARQISRNAIYRIVLLASGIVGFSVTLFSIPAFQQNLTLSSIQYSWYFFLATIITGSLLLLGEGRIRYAKTWKVRQTSSWTQSMNEYTASEHVLAALIVLYSILYPANLTFNKMKAAEHRLRLQSKVNGLVVHRLARLEHALVVLENISFICFVIGLILLVHSFKI